MTMSAATIFLSALTVAAGASFGQTKDKAGRPPAPAAQPNSADTTEAAAVILAKLREKIAATRAMSYEFRATPIGAEGAAFAGEASMARADAGGWRVYARQTDAEGGFEVAYDGANGRSVRAKDKVVAERSMERMDDVRAFFGAESARHAVPWEVLAERPFEDATATLGKPQTIAGEQCDVLEVAGPAPQDEKAPRRTTRVFVSRSSSLPVRVESLLTKEPGVAPTGWALEMHNLKADEDAVVHAFTLEVPEGYRVRAGGTSRRTAQGDGDNEAGGGDGGKTAAAGPAGGAAWPSDRTLLAPGDLAPDFKLQDADGKAVGLEDYRGKVLVMDFWATWCPPCRASMPAMERLHKKYDGKAVAIVGFNAEGGRSGADPVKFKSDAGYTYGLLLGADAIGRKFRVAALPTFYVIDREGKVVWAGKGLAAPPGSNAPTTDQRVKYLEETIAGHIDRALEKAK
ncbi:MAG TPA: TlpA disulfide reductase family protein [Phycisphaerales bacterium]|nr:TlpA disulfide reductase family protein [Phycisphaerales bacterium]